MIKHGGNISDCGGAVTSSSPIASMVVARGGRFNLGSFVVNFVGGRFKGDSVRVSCSPAPLVVVSSSQEEKNQYQQSTWVIQLGFAVGKPRRWSVALSKTISNLFCSRN
ncbi:hypothetical protein AMTR_s00072p00198720 [Amborella trichopoda]|uniref:Uncharacterized protein n=1 Tax=Amborella trichopoda TaxID=13333 RepID=W1NS89_AMBTC|nr:hypothetical protein AMTR_s00072p00198720 [Amborella trichopoda]